MRTALTIAGSDSGAGAGIQADLKTFAAFGVYGTTAITAVTAQNTRGVTDVVVLPAPMVLAQIRAVVEDIGADAVKIGMLGSGAIADVVADAIGALGLRRVVLDTVLASTSGTALVDAYGVDVLKRRLLRLSDVVTVNTDDAFRLTGIQVASVAAARAAAARLHDAGAAVVVVKGGHLEGPATDVLYDGSTFTELTAARIVTRHTHGTGCTFAAAIAAGLARGEPINTAVESAKNYVSRAIAAAPGLGNSRGPLDHFPT